MKIKLITDAPKHNLALMRLSTKLKDEGHDVFLGTPQDPCEISYGSWLFQQMYHTDYAGGVAVDTELRLPLNGYKPDYSLFPIDYSLGWTWEYCPRNCDFCVVPKQHNPKEHHSIWEFHDSRFQKICLLNNNTFTDPQWRETFAEIWEAHLTVVDQNGYDLRLMDLEKLEYINLTKFEGLVHFAFDSIEDECQIRQGLFILRGIKHQVQIYVLVGFPEWRWVDETDITRCQIIADAGFDPFVMVYNRKVRSKEPRMAQLNQFQRLVNRIYSWRKLGFEKAWDSYRLSDK